MNVTIESVKLLLDRIYFGSHYPINNRNMNDDIKKNGPLATLTNIEMNVWGMYKHRQCEIVFSEKS